MKVKYGGIVSAASGKLDASVHSHNRYGRYVRVWVKPTNNTSSAAQDAKSYFASASQAWGGLTDNQRESWNTWAQTHPVTDRLGDQIVLTGHTAYVQLNTRLIRMAVAQITTPPAIAPPASITTLTLSPDIGIGTFDVVYAISPVPAAVQYWVKYAVVHSAGITYVRNLLVLISLIDAAETTPLDAQAAIEARLGTLTVGNIIHAEAYAVSKANGQRSASVFAKGTVVET